MPHSSNIQTGDPTWFKEAVLYELHVKAFHDSNGDGIGDFLGLIQKLDYLAGLGITVIWLLPFYPSPQKDDGYDIADYMSINPDYGTLNDFRLFLREAHRREIRVFIELVLNHTSDQHPWFQRARRSKPGSKWREYYVWSESPEKYQDARIIFKDFETSNWTWDPVAKAYYWHRFYSHQPDLNFDNPRVQNEMYRILDFWLDMGVDGFRLDAIPYLYEREGTNCENLSETFDFLKRLRTYVESQYTDKVFLAEANQWPEDAVAYFGTGDMCHMAFHFPVMPRMFLALRMEDTFPIIDILEQTPAIPESCQWAIFLRNHDELTLEMVTDEERDYMYRAYTTESRAKINLGIRRRLAPLLNNNRRAIEIMNILLFSLPGTPVLYYGDEIGIGDNIYLGDRNGVRTPMQWSSDRNAGFSRANPQKLYLPVIIDPEYHYEALNVENQEQNLSSLLWWTKRVIGVRKQYPAFGRGTLEFLNTGNSRVLAFLRQYQDESILVVLNLSRFSQVIEVELPQFLGFVPQEIFSQNEFPKINTSPYIITLTPHGYFWFLLNPEKQGAQDSLEPLLISLPDGVQWTAIFESPYLEALEHTILPAYIRRNQWCDETTRKIRRLEIRDFFPLTHQGATGLTRNSSENDLFMTLFTITFAGGEERSYQTLITPAFENEAHKLSQQFPQAVIARLHLGNHQGILFDSIHEPQGQHRLFSIAWRRRKFTTPAGELIGLAGKPLSGFVSETPPPARVLGGHHGNTLLQYGDKFFLKLYRGLEPGVNPEVELNYYLTEEAKFSHTPAYAGLVEYKSYTGKSAVVALIQQFQPFADSAWEWVLKIVGQFYEHILSQQNQIGKPPVVQPSLWDAGFCLVLGDEEAAITKHFLEMIRLLGFRTAEMHLALAAKIEDPDFAPEPFSLLYQRSVYQYFRTQIRRLNQRLKRSFLDPTSTIPPQTALLCDLEAPILKYFRMILNSKINAVKIRVHGDYHLGQILFTGRDFSIVDFEGNQKQPVGERRLKRSSFRDIAGMIRSFHLATDVALRHHPNLRETDIAFLEPWIETWYFQVSHTFLHAYLEKVTGTQIVPQDASVRELLLNIFLLAGHISEIEDAFPYAMETIPFHVRCIQSIVTNFPG